MTDALLLTMMDPPPGGDAEFNDWVNTEHLPERKAIPGIRTAIRFRNLAPSPRYMAIYDLEDISVLKSPAYSAIAGDNLSPWSKRILAGASARWRFEGVRIDAGLPDARTGEQEPLAALLLVLWRGLPARCDDHILGTLRTAVADITGMSRWRAFCGGANGRTDYLGIVEATRSFEADHIAPERFSNASLRCDGTIAFQPL